MLSLDTPTRQFIEMDGQDGRLAHMPGLDGLRGLAVAGVIAYHTGHGFMPGGFLGVSTFFTLSGFLITSLLLSESRRTGTVNLRAFWGRRFRRLLPASHLTLLLVVLGGFTVWTADQRLDLRGDVLASLLQVANWRFVLQDTAYGDLFAAPSPVLHFWSLAIEEQFYLLFPLLLALVLRLARGSRWRVGGVLAALAMGSWCLPLVISGTDRIYFGTDTRAVELLLGGVLAVVLSHREVRRRTAQRYRWRSAVLAAGAAALAVQLVWWFTVEQTSSWLYRGGLGLYGALSTLVIAAVAIPSGPLRAVLSSPVLRWLGERSYGLYLIHWPLFLALRLRFPDLDSWLRTAVGVTAACLLAELSYRLVERPVRAGRWPVRGTGGRVAVGSVLVVALVALVPLPVDEDRAPIDFDAAFDEFESRRPDTTDPAADETTTTAAPEAAPVPRIATFGDSTALLMALGLDEYRTQEGLPAGVFGSVELGCGVSRFDAIRLQQEVPVAQLCVDWPQRWEASLIQERPDIAQLVTGVWEVADARLPGAADFSGLGDPEVDAFVRSELLAAVDVLSSTGALVLMVLWPRDVEDIGAGESVFHVPTPPERIDRFHQIQREVAAERPDTVRVLDLAAWLGDRGQDPAWRPDGVHLPEERAVQVYREWMAAETDRIWQEWWTERTAGSGG